MERVILAIIVVAALALLWTQKLRMDLTAILVLLSLTVPWPHPDGKWRGILTPEEGFAGFGSPAVIMVGAMFIFGGALARTGAAEFLAMRLFKATARKEWLLQLTILCMTTLVSMFINDTTVVLVFLPLIFSICRETKQSPSRFLLIAAYGSLLGGQWTLIGTRSNLIISDFYRQRTGTGLGFFEFTPIAIVIFVLCGIYFLMVGRRFLPRTAKASGSQEQREYLSEAVVTKKSTSVGKAFQELGWMDRKDVEVVELLRGNKPLSPQTPLESGDRIIMRGAVSAVGELLKSPDFQLKEEIKISEETLQSVNLVTVEAILSPSSRYIGRTFEETNLKKEYGFTVLGISHHGSRMRQRRTPARLAMGDSLLLLGESDHLERLQKNSDLMLLTKETFPALGKRKALLTLLLLAIVIGLALPDLVSPSITVPFVAFLAIVLGCIRVSDAYEVIDWPALVTIAGMIPLGRAMEKTGSAADLAKFLVETFSSAGPVATLGAVLAVGLLLTQLIENAAVAVILSPLVFRVAETIHVNPKPFMVGLAICVSGGFCTPFAHESTLLVMNPGHYRFKHYLQLGAAFAFITWFVATFLTPHLWSLDAIPVKSAS